MKKNTTKIVLFVLMACVFSTFPIFATEVPLDENGWPIDTQNATAELSATDGGVAATDTEQAAIDKVTYGEADISAAIEPYSTSDNNYASNIYAQYADSIPDVSIDDAIEWSNRKGFEIIKFLQTFIQPFTIIVFMIAAIMTLIGSIGRGDLAGKGLWGMVMSVLVYAAVLYAPVILQTLVGWLGS